MMCLLKYLYILAIANKLASLGVTVIVGGGDSVSAVKKAGVDIAPFYFLLYIYINKNIRTFFSTGIILSIYK
mgnify:CR=1 FL=1